MKRIAMLMVVMAMAIAAPASAGYLLYANSTDTVGANYGSSVTLSNNANMLADQAFVIPTNAYAMALTYTGDVNTGADFAKVRLLKTYMQLAPPSSWILAVNAGIDYAAATQDVRFWAGSGLSTTGTWYVNKLYDPIANVWGKTEMGSFDATGGNGSQLAPLFKVNVPAFKTSAPAGALNGYIFEITQIPIPEPGSMVAMLSGLVGLVGFGIRRRR